MEKVENSFTPYNINVDSGIELQRTSLDEICKKPTLLILGGNQTTTDGELMRYSYIVSNMLTPNILEKLGKNFSITILKYNSGEILDNTTYTNREYDYKGLSKKVFLPLISKNGERISIEQAKSNLKNISVFAHSAGSLVLNRTLCGLLDQMAELNYSEEEMAQMFKEIKYLGYAPYETIDLPITATYVTPLKDSLMSVNKILTFMENNGYDEKYLLCALHNERLVNSVIGKYPCGNEFGVIIPSQLTSMNQYDDHGFAGTIRNLNHYLKPKYSPIANRTGRIISTKMSSILSDYVKDSIYSPLIRGDFLELENCIKPNTYIPQSIETTMGD